MERQYIPTSSYRTFARRNSSRTQSHTFAAAATGMLAKTNATTPTNTTAQASISQCVTAYNRCMKPIVVRDSAKFDRILGKLAAMPPEKRSGAKATPKVTPKR